MGLFRRKKRVYGLKERSPHFGGLTYGDLGVLGAMMERGADLTKPRHVLHYSYFPSRDAADAAAAETAEHGWRTEVRPGDPEPAAQWCVVAEREDVVLHPDYVRESSALFEEIATRHGGDHDGWEGAI